MNDLFCEALKHCDEDEPDFDWNKDLKIEKPETYVYGKHFNKSMINQKSDTIPIHKGNETAYSPGVFKSSGLYLKPEDQYNKKIFKQN